MIYFFLESRLLVPETEGEGSALFACHDLFFLLDSQVVRIFRLKKRLTNLRTVMCVICERMLFKMRGISQEVIGQPSS